jgi:GH25 family lysozyme M1 (1,4-beta-N-acetylmuramidase)
MIVKIPAIYDGSHWIEIPDFALISPRPALFITKATEGYWFQDEKFIPFFEDAARVGFQRGAFHFNRKAANAIKQAQYFCDFIRPHITDRDYLILDVEEGGEKPSDLWVWLEYVHTQFPDNRRMIYGRKNLLDPIPMTAGERAYFREIPTWVAGYPWFPDLWNTPAGYIPDQTKYGPVWIWQYADNGKVTGIQGDVDLNMATAEFLPILYAGVDPDPTPIPPEEEDMTITFTGKVKNTATQNANVRVDADTSATPVGTLAPGTAFTAEGQKVFNDGYDWLHIVTPTPGWLALTSNIEYQAVTPPAPSVDKVILRNFTFDATIEINGRFYDGTAMIQDLEFKSRA